MKKKKPEADLDRLAAWAAKRCGFDCARVVKAGTFFVISAGDKVVADEGWVNQDGEPQTFTHVKKWTIAVGATVPKLKTAVLAYRKLQQAEKRQGGRKA